MTEVIEADWLNDPILQKLLATLNQDGGEARIAGGAVRNTLLNQPVADIDIATTLVPRDVILRLNEAGFKPVPTGIAHGTVTAVFGEQSFEVTTLRSDVATDGRHATVVYGTDWKADAQRRDLTMNALYLMADGRVVDPLGGFSDILSQTVRFIDDAEKRIQEDYLRILRFFRFFAWYGKFRPDSEGLKACAKLKSGMENLSAERIWQELSKLFAAPDPGRAILWMRQTGVLSQLLPETEKWGIDALPGLMSAEQRLNWQPDNLLRLMAILPPDASKLASFAKRLKLPNTVRDRLISWAGGALPDAGLKEPQFQQWLYWQDKKASEDRIRLAIAANGDDAKKYQRQLKWLARWQKPSLPVRGDDLVKLGMSPGPKIAQSLKFLEELWVESGFKLSREALLDKRPDP